MAPEEKYIQEALKIQLYMHWMQEAILRKDLDDVKMYAEELHERVKRL